MRLWFNDVNFDRNVIIVRQAKGNKTPGSPASGARRNALVGNARLRQRRRPSPLARVRYLDPQA